jgi:hypothetical protein
MDHLKKYKAVSRHPSSKKFVNYARKSNTYNKLERQLDCCLPKFPVPSRLVSYTWNKIQQNFAVTYTNRCTIQRIHEGAPRHLAGRMKCEVSVYNKSPLPQPGQCIFKLWEKERPTICIFKVTCRSKIDILNFVALDCRFPFVCCLNIWFTLKMHFVGLFFHHNRRVVVCCFPHQLHFHTINYGHLPNKLLQQYVILLCVAQHDLPTLKLCNNWKNACICMFGPTSSHVISSQRNMTRSWSPLNAGCSCNAFHTTRMYSDSLPLKVWSQHMDRWMDR